MTKLVEVTQERPVPDQTSYRPSAIRLYGVPLFFLHFKDDTIWCHPYDPQKRLALIYGFCYQGHCYSLPEPVVIMVQGDGVPAEGCGWDNTQYRSWNVDKLDPTILLQVQSDTFEELILNRCTNVAKQPIAYSIAYQMSHRGGKLTE